MLEAQEQAGLDPDFWLVAPVHGQLLLLPPSDAFLQRVTGEGDLAAGWRPHDDEASPVHLDPYLRHGRPAVGGVSTSATLGARLTTARSVDGSAEPRGQLAEQILLVVTDPRHVAVRPQQRRGHVQFLADVDDVVNPICPARHREPAGLVEQ